jgi:hypothetical protein
MATLHVGPTRHFHTIAAAMSAAVAGDTILLDHGYHGEHATVTHNGMTISGRHGRPAATRGERLRADLGSFSRL